MALPASCITLGLLLGGICRGQRWLVRICNPDPINTGFAIHIRQIIYTFTPMGIRNKISPGYTYYLTLTVVGWIDLFTRPVYKHVIVDSLNYMTAFLEEKMECIRNNPVKAELVANPEEYLYSSARDYAGEKGMVNLEFV